MKFISIVVLFVCAERAWSAPQGAGQNAPVTEPIAIVRQESNIEPDGTYQYSYETANGIQADETGTLKKATSPDTNDVIIAQGKYSYTAPDGTLISITYVADDVGGFQPQGAHIPTPPPIPPEIQKALDFIASQPPAQNN